MPLYKVPLEGEFIIEAHTPEEARSYAAGWLFLMMDKGRPQGRQPKMFPVHWLGVSDQEAQEITDQEGPSAGAPPEEYLKQVDPGQP